MSKPRRGHILFIFEIIGEAVKEIPEEIKTKYTDVEWKEAAGFREVLNNDYLNSCTIIGIVLGYIGLVLVALFLS